VEYLVITYKGAVDDDAEQLFTMQLGDENDGGSPSDITSTFSLSLPSCWDIFELLLAGLLLLLVKSIVRDVYGAMDYAVGDCSAYGMGEKMVF